MTWHDDQPRPFDSFTAEDIPVAASIIVDGIRRDSRRSNLKITPFATARDLMDRSPPARWRLLARWLWFKALHRRIVREIANQVAFAKHIRAIADIGRQRCDLCPHEEKS